MEQMKEQPILVMTNLPDLPTADAVARHLVEKRLAACVNRLSPVHSIYRWQGKIEECSEITLLIKTTQKQYAQLEAAIKALHPYELPELIGVPIAAGLPGYLVWIVQETKSDVAI